MDLRRALALFVMLLSAAAAPAQTAAGNDAPAVDGSALTSELSEQVRRLALEASHSAPGAPRVEVSVGHLDARLRLAPCQQVQAYVPDGVRLWGKSRVGLRCVQGPTKWNVYLPITVKVFGTALVATSGAGSNSVLTGNDLVLAEVDIAEDASPPVGRAELAVGRTLARPIKPGQSLRQSHLKARQWFSAGETVTVLAQGNGFSVASEAQALNPGIEGQPVRVRTESGRVLTGQPVGERRVELSL